MEQSNVKKMMRYRWMVWGLLATAYIIVFFHRFAAGVVKDNLIQDLQISETAFASLGAMYFYAYMFMQIPVGFLADSLGARKTVTIGSLLAAIGSIMFGLAPSVFFAFAGRFIVGLGVSVVFISTLKILSQWFKESEFGTMSGITSFVGNMGGLIAQTPLVWMVSMFTWRNTFIAIGVVTLFVTALIYIFVRNTPQEKGFPSIASIEGKEEKHEAKEKVNLLMALTKVITNWRTWPPFIIFASFFGAFTVLSGFFGTSYMVDVYGLEKGDAANYMMAAVLGLAIGSIVIGRVSDKLKSRKLPMLVSGGLLLLTWSILIFAGGGKPPLGIMYPLYFVLGLSTSAFVLGWACGKELNNPKFAGLSTSVVNMGGFFGSAVLPTFVGKALASGNDLMAYNHAFKIAYACIVLGFIAIFFVKETGCKNIYKG